MARGGAATWAAYKGGLYARRPRASDSAPEPELSPRRSSSRAARQPNLRHSHDPGHPPALLVARSRPRVPSAQ